MNDLALHLIEAGSHGGLSFNPACPVCREERLSGALVRPPLVPRRAQAGLAAALLATGAVPTAALANPGHEPESEHQGLVPGAPPSTSDDGEAGSSSGAATPLHAQPLTVAPPDDGDSETDEPGGVEVPPPDEDDEDDGEPAAPAPAAGSPIQPSDPGGGETQAGSEDPAGEGGGHPGAQAEGAPEADGKGDRAREGSERKSRSGRARGDAPAGGGRAGPPAGTHGAGAPSAGTQVAVAPAAAAAAGPAAGARGSSSAAAAAGGERATRGARLHVVRSGESLWSIARDLLGPDAANAEVAREVHRLWDLNAAAIGTGDPDLLIAGQTLRLR